MLYFPKFQRKLKHLFIKGIFLLNFGMFVFFLKFKSDPSTVTKSEEFSNKTSKINVIDWINNENAPVSQDDPLLVQFVRDNYIRYANNFPYNLVSSKTAKPGELDFVTQYLKNDSGGFFVEANAHDGELGSNTLYLEKVLGWNGLLVEPSPSTFTQLLAKNRKAFHAQIALSTKPYPMLDEEEGDARSVHLYTLLLAVNQTVVDLLSLHLRGSESELNVLKSIPFHKFTIKVVAVELVNVHEGIETVINLMTTNGYAHAENEDGLGESAVFIRK